MYDLQYLEEKIQPIKKIIIEKIQKKNCLKLDFFKKNSDRFSKKSLQGVLAPYVGYVHTEFGINRTSSLGVRLYTDRQTNSQTNSFFYYYYRIYTVAY